MKIASIAAGVALLGSLGFTAAQAQTTWQQNHPWRAYDNSRLRNQNYRITQGVRDDQLTHAQAHALRSDDHAIRAEERADASVNGGHLTRYDERQIYRQENANSRAIYRGRHR